MFSLYPFTEKLFLISFSLLIIVFALFNFQSAQASLALSRFTVLTQPPRLYKLQTSTVCFCFACSVAFYRFNTTSASLQAANLNGSFRFLFKESLVGLSGLEPPTSRLSGVRSNRLSYKPLWLRSSLRSPLSHYGGDEEDRTPDPLLARQVLSQLSYTPICVLYCQLRLLVLSNCL